MSLLHDDTLAQLDQAALASVDRFDVGLRGALWAGGQTPSGITRGDPELISRHFAKMANQEQSGTAPGDLNTTMTQHPAVQEMMAGQLQPEVQPEGAV